MSNIKVSDLSPTGSELFFDTESYMIELSDEINIRGGTWQNTGSILCYTVDPTGHFTQSSATVHTPHPNDSFGD